MEWLDDKKNNTKTLKVKNKKVIEQKRFYDVVICKNKQPTIKIGNWTFDVYDIEAAQNESKRKIK